MNLSPFVVEIFDGFAIYWNSLSYVLSFVFGFLLIRWMTLRQRSDMKVGMTLDFVVYCSMGSLVGGRLGYCFFYAPELFLKFKAEFPFWGVFALSEGGMSSHGALLGLILVAWLFSVLQGVSRLYLYDLLAFVAPIGIFFVRGASFLTGELYGRAVDSFGFFATKFPAEILQWPLKNPAKLDQLAELGQKYGNLQGTTWAEQKALLTTDPQAVNQISDVLEKLLLEYWRGNGEVISGIQPLLPDRYPTQLYGAAGEGVLLFFILFVFWFKPRKPGVVAALFLILSSVFRIAIERYAEFEFMGSAYFLGWSQSQWLSGATFALGLILLFIWGRRETLRTTGWGRGQHVNIHRR